MKNKLRFFCWLLLLGCICPAPAYAYLDPGTGSMLVSALIGISATLFFLLKNFYYKAVNLFYFATGRAVPKSEGAIVFYGEGRQYWNTFKPILEEFESRGAPAIYLAADEADPALQREWRHISVRHIGMGNRGFSVLNMLEADICVMTTPGLDVLQIRRSPGVKHYCHIVHAVTDMALYKLYSFDYFDSVMCSGAHQIKSLRHLESARSMPSKLLLETGCCYMDTLADAVTQAGALAPDHEPEAGPRILYAPTWGANGLLRRFGPDLLLPLAKAGYRLTLRPHPQSFISETELIDSLRKALEPYPNVQWDNAPTALEAMRNSDVLVSDLSGIVFDYAFVLERPVITVTFTPDLRGMDGMDLPFQAWELEVLPQLGARLDPADIGKLPNIIAALPERAAFAARMRALRDESVYNFGQGSKAAAVQLLELHKNLAGQKG